LFKNINKRRKSQSKTIYFLYYQKQKGELVTLAPKCREIAKQSLNVDFVGQFHGLK